MNQLIRSLLVAGIAFVAVEARATYSISIETSAPQKTTLGASGQSFFDISFTDTIESGSLWSFRSYQLQGVDSKGAASAGFFSNLTVDPSSTLLLGDGQTYESGNAYHLVLNWTVANDATPDLNGNGIYFNLFVKQPDEVNANAGATDTLTVSQVPEPSTAVLLLAGGIAVCLRRRL